MTAPAALVESYRRLKAALIAEYPELALDDQTLTDTLEGIHGAQDIITKLIRRAKEDEASVDALETLEAEYAKRRQRIATRAAAQKKAALEMMQECGISKVERPELTAWIGHSKPRVVVLDESALPDNMVEVITIRKPNKDAIKAAVDEGQTIPGVAMTNGSEYLSVRIAK